MVNKETVSTINPEVQQKPKPDIVWNDGDIKAYTDIGVVQPGHMCMFELNFLNVVDLRKGPIERTVLRMFRLRAPDYTTPKHERKEFLYYEERWEGKDWRGIPLNPVDHMEGLYTKRFLKPHLNQETGEVDYNELDLTKTQLTYTIPWNKKNVDDIIANSAHTDRESITFTIKFASEDNPSGRMPTHNNFSYEQFTEWKWEDIYKFHTAPHGLTLDKTKTAYSLRHEPS